MKLNFKAQSAMEYLMTYGWAILIILIAIGALFYLGVFTPSVPNTCMFNTPFSCIGGDIKGDVSDTYISFKVGFATGSAGGINAITINGVSMTMSTSTGNPNVGECRATPIGLTGWVAGTQKEIKCSTTLIVGTILTLGQKFNGQVTFTSISDAGITHTTTGSFSGTLEA